jgi:Fe-S cluster biogenesis protein NfuA
MEDYMEQQETQSDPLKQKVEEVIESLRPALQMDGGDMEFVGLEEGTVLLRLTGACAGCPMSTITLKMGIEARLKRVIPEIKGVVAV